MAYSSHTPYSSSIPCSPHTHHHTPSTTRKVALVIGVSDYPSSPLSQPATEARVISETLSLNGFPVTRAINPDYRTMKRAIDEFVATLDSNCVSFFYFSGHGTCKDNYQMLLPTDWHESRQGIKVEELMHAIKRSGSKYNIMIMDCCRNWGGCEVEGFKSMESKSSYTPISTIMTPSNVGSPEFLMSYACEPCKMAIDGCYTSALIRHLFNRRISIGSAMDAVVEEVRTRTNGRQVPLFVSSNYKLLQRVFAELA